MTEERGGNPRGGAHRTGPATGILMAVLFVAGALAAPTTLRGVEAPPPAGALPEPRMDLVADTTPPADTARSGSRIEAERPPGTQPFDALDAVAIPFRVAAYPLRLVWEGVAWGAGRLTGVGPPSALTRTYRSVVDWGLAFQFTSFGERSGPAAGLRFTRYSPFYVESAYSIRQSQLHRAGVEGPAAGGSAWLDARFRRDAEANFWGVGPGSDEVDRTDFRQDQWEVDSGWRLPGPGPLTGELRAGYENTSVGRGFDRGRPDLQDVFDTSDLFGAEERTEFARLGLAGEVDLAERRGFHWRGVRLRGRGTLYRGVSETEADFRRVRAELDGYLPLNPRQYLAVHSFLESNRGSSGRGVPFTHLATIGSSQAGRGFSTGRFRDRDALGLMAEWRYEVWRQHMDAARAEWFLFVDQGTVAPALSRLGDERWVTSFGLGLRVVKASGLLGMGVLSFGEEGTKVRLRGEWTH